MSGYAVWFFANRENEQLVTKFTPDIADITATRAHLAQSQSWALDEWRAQQQLSDALVGRAMKAYLSLLGKPLIMTMGNNGRAAHASVVFAYDDSFFYFYDVNFPGETQQLAFDGSAFGSYGTYNDFGFVGMPSLGRTEDFGDLTSEAESGYTSSSDITLSSPTTNQMVSSHSVNLTGALSGSLNPESKLLAIIKGVDQIIPVAGGAFDRKIQVSAGRNTVVLFAGVPIEGQSNWYKNAATLIRDFEGTLPATELIVTLTWNQDQTDVDLYVTDPNGQTAYYITDGTPSGLVLDFDDTDGFGPEHITLTPANGGQVLAGNYSIRAHYYSGSPSISGTVTVVLKEGQEEQLRRDFPFRLTSANSGNQAPSGTGPDWATIAFVDLIQGVVTAP